MPRTLYACRTPDGFVICRAPMSYPVDDYEIMQSHNTRDMAMALCQGQSKRCHTDLHSRCASQDEIVSFAKRNGCRRAYVYGQHGDTWCWHNLVYPQAGLEPA